jgi:hypothetical protein
VRACVRCLARGSTKDCEDPMAVRGWVGLCASCDEIWRGKTWDSNKVDCAAVWKLPEC